MGGCQPMSLSNNSRMMVLLTAGKGKASRLIIIAKIETSSGCLTGKRPAATRSRCRPLCFNHSETVEIVERLLNGDFICIRTRRQLSNGGDLLPGVYWPRRIFPCRNRVSNASVQG